GVGKIGLTWIDISLVFVDDRRYFQQRFVRENGVVVFGIVYLDPAGIDRKTIPGIVAKMDRQLIIESIGIQYDLRKREGRISFDEEAWLCRKCYIGHVKVLGCPGHHDVIQMPQGFQSSVGTVIPESKLETVDRKSTRLNSSHVKISYAVFCLKKKRKTQ